MRRDAAISDCGRYRYCLWRQWGEGPCVDFIMLNPSTADGKVDDPTIRRCIGFAKRWGAGSLRVLNLFAYRATDPKQLKAVDDPVGPDNDWWIQGYQDIPEPYEEPLYRVCAWGSGGRLLGRDREVLGMFNRIHALRLNTDGSPAHPLYLPKDLTPFEIGMYEAQQGGKEG